MTINATREAALKARVTSFYAALAKGEAPAAGLFAPDYTPHTAPLENVPVLEAGLAPLLARLGSRGAVPHTLYRMIADGDFVYAHLRYEGAPPIAAIDFFRFDDQDRIAEHWNVRQVLPRDIDNGLERMEGGGDDVTVISAERRAEMKALLQRSQEEVWGQANADAVGLYYDPDYIQHNHDMPGGAARILHLVKTEMKAYIERTGGPFPIEFIRMGANGDLVFLYYSVPMAGIGRNEGEKSRSCDIFRIDGRNKLIEHWDVLQMGSEPLPDDRSLF